MYRGTTPTIVIHVNSDNIDLDSMSQIWITFRSQIKEITKDISVINVDDDKKQLSVTLTQEETLQFGNGDISCQARFLTSDGKAYASNIKKLRMDNVLKEGIIYGNDG